MEHIYTQNYYRSLCRSKRPDQWLYDDDDDNDVADDIAAIHTDTHTHTATEQNTLYSCHAYG